MKPNGKKNILIYKRKKKTTNNQANSKKKYKILLPKVNATENQPKWMSAKSFCRTENGCIMQMLSNFLNTIVLRIICIYFVQIHPQKENGKNEIIFLIKNLNKAECKNLVTTFVSKA